MSSCLINGGGRTYRLDLEIVAKSSSTSSRSSHSSPTSTLSESSTSTPFFISTKRARAPRKRPNQISNEAVALLSTISPKLFSPSNLLGKNYFPVLLPSFPIPDDAALLLREPPSLENKGPISLYTRKPFTAICSPACFPFQDPGSPNFVAESILDEEADESIDSIMGVGNISMRSDYMKDSSNGGLMGFGDIQFGFDILSNMRRALKRSDDGEWWRSPVVVVNDIVPKLQEEPPVNTRAKKKNKEKEKAEEGDVERNDVAADSSPEDAGDGVMRDASIQRYKEKRMNQLFSKNIHYHDHKVNAEQRPRMKRLHIEGETGVLASELDRRSPTTTEVDNTGNCGGVCGGKTGHSDLVYGF